MGGATEAQTSNESAKVQVNRIPYEAMDVSLSQCRKWEYPTSKLWKKTQQANVKPLWCIMIEENMLASSSHSK